MNETKLIEDKKQQSDLKDDTKYLIEETLTIIIEIVMAKTLNHWTDEDIERVAPYKRFRGTQLIHKRSDGFLIIEYSDAICLLKEYFSSSPFCAPYKNWIVSEHSGDDEFVEKKFRKEFDLQCEKERNILEILGDSRNKEYAHSIERANMGDLYMWIRQLMKYLDCFISYRMHVLAEYDKNFGKIDDLKKLESYYTKASELKEKCFVSKENYKEFRFGKNTYKISREDKEDFGLLVSDMARNWKTGIKYLRSARINEVFIALMAEYFVDYNIIVDYESLHERFILTEEGSVDESVLYMAILYLVYPQISGIYWKGVRYSDSYFASMVLQILTRHPEKYSLDEKIETLEYRINNFEEWCLDNEIRKGLGLNLVLFCEEKILSQYFMGQGDRDAAFKANKFEEDIIMYKKDKEFLKKGYDDFMLNILDLTFCMKGKISYILPIPEKMDGRKTYPIFSNTDEFRTYFIKILSQLQNIEEVASFIYKIRSDLNLKWFMDKENS